MQLSSIYNSGIFTLSISFKVSAALIASSCALIAKTILVYRNAHQSAVVTLTAAEKAYVDAEKVYVDAETVRKSVEERMNNPKNSIKDRDYFFKLQKRAFALQQRALGRRNNALLAKSVANAKSRSTLGKVKTAAPYAIAALVTTICAVAACVFIK